MARKLRVEYPGAICHVMNRNDGIHLNTAAYSYLANSPLVGQIGFEVDPIVWTRKRRN